MRLVGCKKTAITPCCIQKLIVPLRANRVNFIPYLFLKRYLCLPSMKELNNYFLFFMKLKTIDNAFDGALVIIFFLLAVCSWFFAKSMNAPSFELVRADVKIPYEYTAEDGNSVKSFYRLAWHHEQFSRPKVVVYDPNRGDWSEFKDEYVEKYEAMMPDSQYSFWNRCFLLLFAVFVIISGLFLYYVGGFIRDTVLYLITIQRNTFPDCACFLFYDRICFKKQVREQIGSTIDEYINTQTVVLSSKYAPSFVDLLIKLLKDIKQQGDTRIGFYYSYVNNTKKQLDYLNDLSLYWQSQIGKNEKAEQILEDLNVLCKKDYEDFHLKVSADDFSGIVSDELKRLFSDVMGDDVFDFYAYKAEFDADTKVSGAIYVTTTVENSSKMFRWSRSLSSEKFFPGLAVLFTIYHYENGEKKILWNKFLPPKCTYEARRNSLVDSDEVYTNMIESTIRSFSNSLKKSKN